MAAGLIPALPEPPLLARVWAALSGGDLTDPESRALARRIEAQFPGATAMVDAARRFHAGAARRAVQDGARGVIFGAAGLPGNPQLHEDAALALPGVRFAYVDWDESVTLLRRAGLHRAPYGERCAAVLGRMRDPGTILAAAEDAGLKGPLHVQWQWTATCLPDGAARAAVAAWAQELGPGGSLALSVGMPGEQPARADDLPAGMPEMYAHTAAAIRSWLEDAGLQEEEPGVVSAETWPLAAAEERREAAPWIAVAAGRVR